MRKKKEKSGKNVSQSQNQENSTETPDCWLMDFSEDFFLVFFRRFNFEGFCKSEKKVPIYGPTAHIDRYECCSPFQWTLFIFSFSFFYSIKLFVNGDLRVVGREVGGVCVSGDFRFFENFLK